MPMIDKLQSIAGRLQFLRLPAVALGLVSLAAMIFTIVSSKSHEEDYYLIPSIVGLLWSMASYSFLVNFSSVPEKGDSSWKLFARLKRRAVRTGYWLLAALFILTTLSALFISYRMITIWLRDFAG
ncbi:MAG: hypothetical protein P8166_09785 [Candidatus Thiodiazotropha sp.]